LLDPGEGRIDHHVVMASFMLKPILHFNSYHEKKGLEICLISNLVPKYSIKLHFIHHQNKNNVFFKIINSLIQPVDLTFTHDTHR
jgi:hypothetical protein